MLSLVVRAEIEEVKGSKLVDLVGGATVVVPGLLQSLGMESKFAVSILSVSPSVA